MFSQKSVPTHNKRAGLWLATSIALSCAVPPVRAAEEQSKLAITTSSDSRPLPRHFAKITTLDGKTYQEVTVQKVQPDGLLVEFNTPGGGFGTSKLKFRNLPADLRDQYGFDARQAEAFENSQAEGERVWNARNEAWTERREAALTQQMAREQRLKEQTDAQEASRAAAGQPRAEQQSQPPPSYGWPWYGGGWYQPRHHTPHHVTQQQPTPPVSPFISPMRPLGK